MNVRGQTTKNPDQNRDDLTSDTKKHNYQIQKYLQVYYERSRCDELWLKIASRLSFKGSLLL